MPMERGRKSRSIKVTAEDIFESFFGSRELGYKEISKSISRDRKILLKVPYIVAALGTIGLILQPGVSFVIRVVIGVVYHYVACIFLVLRGYAAPGIWPPFVFWKEVTAAWKEITAEDIRASLRVGAMFVLGLVVVAELVLLFLWWAGKFAESKYNITIPKPIEILFWTLIFLLFLAFIAAMALG